MFVHRLLDVVFRTLDAIDAVRARVDAVLGQEAQPPSSWSPEAPVPPSTGQVQAPAPSTTSAPDIEATSPAPAPAPPGRREARNVTARSPSTTKRTRKAPASTASTAAVAEAPAAKARRGASAAKAAAATTVSATKDAARAGARKAQATKARVPTAAGAQTKRVSGAGDDAARRDSAGVGRKGSVDRSGRDLESPRARAIETWLKSRGRPLVAADAALDGKRTLARVLWAVACAEDAGSEQGLTAADASAFLSSAAGVEVFTTNVGRTFRDEPALFVETIPDGRSKRYKLTEAGRQRLAEIRTR